MTQILELGISEININKDNKFGEGIVFREGSPIQLLEYSTSGNGEFGKITLNPKALNILKPISEPLAIISVGK